MKAYLTTTELPSTAWSSRKRWEYSVQKCCAGEDMRSHVALYFTNRPVHMREYTHNSDVSARGAADVSWDFTSRPFAGFVKINSPRSWYSSFPGAKVYFYSIIGVDAHKLHAAAAAFADDRPPYHYDYKWNAACPWYPCTCNCGRKYTNRPTNCVGATLTVLAIAKGASGDPESTRTTLNLDRTAEWLMPSDAVRQLQDAKIIDKNSTEDVIEIQSRPLLTMKR